MVWDEKVVLEYSRMLLLDVEVTLFGYVVTVPPTNV